MAKWSAVHILDRENLSQYYKRVPGIASVLIKA